MTKNMGNADRAIRTILALGVAALYFTGRISGTLAIVLGVIAVVFLATSPGVPAVRLVHEEGVGRQPARAWSPPRRETLA